MPDTKLFKKIAFLAPRAGMGLAEFSAYWRDTHGPTVAHSPGYAAYRTRYAQNHRIGDGPVGASFPYPGAALFHLPADGNEAAFAASAIYQHRIRVDELRFIDMDRTVSMTATERVIRAGTGPVKLLILGVRQDGWDRDTFDRRVHDLCAGALHTAPGFADHVLGWTVNHIVPGSFRFPGDRPATAFAVDCMQELWFADGSALTDAFASADYRDRLGPALEDLFAARHSYSFRTREIVFFDAGQPIDAAARPDRQSA